MSWGLLVYLAYGLNNSLSAEKRVAEYYGNWKCIERPNKQGTDKHEICYLLHFSRKETSILC